MRTSGRPPPIPSKVNLRPKVKSKSGAAARLVNARDKTSIYAFSQQEHTEKEREQFRKEMKERFTPGARPMPTTLQGLTSLANERIEDAIARGQFKNIQRGKGINTERDHNANSPFLDTTEYFMNKIIQKQEIVPPWIEKQQELLKMTNSFRSRLRQDWRRHAARMIASSGGGVEAQVRRAKGYALAEEMVNPRTEKASHKGIGSDGSLTSITMDEKMAERVVEELQAELKEEGIDVDIKVTRTSQDSASGTTTTITPQVSSTTSSNAASLPSPELPASAEEQLPSSAESTTPASPTPPATPVLPTAHPFRDPAWVSTELAYHTLAIAELNSLTRSYNLQAPKVAQKTYFSLSRELNKCYADVAPTIAEEILSRHNSPRHIVGLGRGRERERGVLGASKWDGHEGRIRDEGEGRGYGWKEFWRDLWKREERGRRQVN